LPDEEYITVEQAAEQSGYSVRHVQYLLKTGRVEGKKFSSVWMVTFEAVMAYKATDPRPGRPKQAG
jgi:hypothetical protein